MALWMASPPTCSVRMPRASLTAMDDFDFLAGNGDHEKGGNEGQRGRNQNRQRVRTVGIERGAGEPRADECAEAGTRVEGADDAGHRARAVEIHDDGRHERDVSAVADAE